MNTVKSSLCRRCMATIAALTAIALIVSCNSDDIQDEAMYTFTGETVASFCQHTPELSNFYQMLEQTGNTSLLSIYGHFTCFPPTNEAIERWLVNRGQTWNDLTTEDMQKVVYSSTISNNTQEFLTTDFLGNATSLLSMQDRTIQISFVINDLGQREIVVNSVATIVSADNEVHNGVVHVVDCVIEPSEETFLQRLSQQPALKVFTRAFEASGFNEQMSDIYDPNYIGPAGYDGEDPSQSHFEHCKLGWTVFAETDEVLREAGLDIEGVDTLTAVEQFASQWYGTKDLGDYTSEHNPLHLFIAYHILNRQMNTGSMVYTGFACAPTYRSKAYEYYETMLQYRLMEIKAGPEINRRRNGQSVHLDETACNIEVMNGYIHTLRDLLIYDEDVMRTDVLHKRIRFDFYSVPPQLTNNHIRWNWDYLSSARAFPQDFCGDYFKYNTGSALTLWASDGWTNYQSDEMLIAGPMYDFTLKMLPVPPGNYEIRLGYRAENWRGIAQLFIDGQIAGIPVDLTIGYNGAENDPRIGYVHDEDTSDDGIENDKMMRNHGYMKAPTSMYTGQEGGKSLRDMSACLRIIIGQYLFQDYGYHYFRAKNMDDKGGGRQFHADYIEYIPVDLLRDEDRE
ncbi:MAG: fasciclin domain-containing protein [Bacteroidaceae bacterium]|nr:fasciclin domain-containing protein [Bacteroidaceae bacterium]